MNAKDVILARRMGGGGGGGVQSDWNINDETDPAYVKNRPFYSVVNYTEIFPEQDVSLQVEQEMGLSIRDNIKFWSGQAPFALGDTLTITFDGNDYNCVARELEGVRALFTLGNASILNLLGGDGGFEDTGEPFFITVDSTAGDFYLAIIVAGTSTNHTIEILKINEEITPVPEKYLPKSAMTMRVEITGNDTDGYSANYTCNEIMAAHNAGKFVYAVYGNELFYLDISPFDTSDFGVIPAMFVAHNGWNDITMSENYITASMIAVTNGGVGFVKNHSQALILKSSESDKRFKITVNDSGTLTATEVT